MSYTEKNSDPCKFSCKIDQEECDECKADSKDIRTKISKISCSIFLAIYILSDFYEWYMSTAWERDCKNFRKNQKRRSGPFDLVIGLLQILQVFQSFYMFIVCG